MHLQAGGSLPTCAEEQKDLHGEELVVGQLQSDKLLTHLPHAETQVVHGGQLHALPEIRNDKGQEMEEGLRGKYSFLNLN